MPRSKQFLKRGLSVSAVAAFVGVAVAGTTYAATLAVGPIEQVNLKASTLVVLGQTYHIDAATAIKNRAGAAVALSALAPNTLVAIDGTETASGQTAVKSVVSRPEIDVPGATSLLVTGVVSAESPTGQIKIGRLTVDIVSTLTSDTPKFQVGNLVEVTGTQPNLAGLFLAQSITPIDGLSGSGAAVINAGLSGSGAADARAPIGGLSGSGAADARAPIGGLSGSGAAVTNAGLSGSGK